MSPGYKPLDTVNFSRLDSVKSCKHSQILPQTFSMMVLWNRDLNFLCVWTCVQVDTFAVFPYNFLTIGCICRKRSTAELSLLIEFLLLNLFYLQSNQFFVHLIVSFGITAPEAMLLSMGLIAFLLVDVCHVCISPPILNFVTVLISLWESQCKVLGPSALASASGISAIWRVRSFPKLQVY